MSGNLHRTGIVVKRYGTIWGQLRDSYIGLSAEPVQRALTRWKDSASLRTCGSLVPGCQKAPALISKEPFRRCWCSTASRESDLAKPAFRPILKRAFDRLWVFLPLNQ